MKALSFLRKLWRTVPLVQESLPLVLDELKDLSGETRKFIVKLKEIWDL